jgi:hypothetical protein
MFALYLDEDTSSTALTDALRSRGVDVLRAFEVGLTERSDEEQLLWAASANRVIYTFNAKHFSALHNDIIEFGRSHAGIIVGHQQRYSVGEQLRRVSRILASRSPEQMRNQILYLSNW